MESSNPDATAGAADEPAYDAIPEELLRSDGPRVFKVNEIGIRHAVVFQWPDNSPEQWLPYIAFTRDDPGEEHRGPVQLVFTDSLGLRDVVDAWERTSGSLEPEIQSLLGEGREEDSVYPDPRAFVEFVRDLPNGVSIPTPGGAKEAARAYPDLFGGGGQLRVGG